MDIKGLESNFKSASKITQTLEEYEFLVKLSSVLVRGFGDRCDNTKSILLTDDELKILDFASRNQDVILSSSEVLDWFIFYIFSRRYRQYDDNSTESPSVASINFKTPWRAVAPDDETKYAERLNGPTESIIAWLETRPLVLQNLRMFTSAIRLAQCRTNVRKHLISHALRWLICSLRESELDFVARSPLALSRGGSFDGLSVAGDLGPLREEGNEKDGDINSKEEWVSTVIESNGALTVNGCDKKPIDQLRLAIEELILVCIGDQMEELRALAYKRLQVFFKTAPLPTSAVFCLRWVEEVDELRLLSPSKWDEEGGMPLDLPLPNRLCTLTCRETDSDITSRLPILRQIPLGNWSKQEGLLRLIQLFVEKLRPANAEAVQAERRGSQVLKQRLAVVLNGNWAKKSTPDEGPPADIRNQSTVTPKEEENIKRLLLPKIRNVTLGLLSSHRLPIRQRAVSIYAACVSFMHPENQAKILENAIATLDLDISTRMGEIANNVTSTAPKLSQYLVESLTILSTAITEMPNAAYCQLEWLKVAALCETLLSHPSPRVRGCSADFLVAIIRRHKDSIQMARAVVIVLTQAWTSHQEALFKPFNQLPKLPEYGLEQGDRSEEYKVAWRLGHLLTFLKVNQMLLEEYRSNSTSLPKAKKTLFTPLFDPHGGRRFTFGGQKSISAFRSRSPSINSAAPLLVRLKQLEATELQQVVWNVRSATYLKKQHSNSFSFTTNGHSVSLSSSGGLSTSSTSGVSSPGSTSTSLSNPKNCGFRTCLTVAFHAGVECSCDPNSAVRNLAVQTLLKVAQVIGLFDHNLLVNIIMTHMSFEPTLLTYGCLEVLRSTLVNLKSGKTGNAGFSCSPSLGPRQMPFNLLHGLLSVERSRVWLRSCAHYIATRETFDAVTLTAVHVVMCALTSVHQLEPLSVGLRQARMNSVDEDSGVGENGEAEASADGKACDQRHEDEYKSVHDADVDIQMDLDIEALMHAINSLTSILENLALLFGPRNKEDDVFGWLPESPMRRLKKANDPTAASPGSELPLEFAYLLLRRVETPLQAYVGCASHRGLATRSSHALPGNAETVAVALTGLVVPLVHLGFAMFMPQLMFRRQSSIPRETGMNYAATLRENCMVSILNIIGIIAACLPKSPFLGINIKGVLDDPKSSNDNSTQDTLNQMELQVNAAAHMQATCEKLTIVVTEIFNFARRNLHPKSFLCCSNWWWMGQMCSSLPNFCQASPGHVDTSHLVELLCNELSSLHPQMNAHTLAVFDAPPPKLSSGPNDRRRRSHIASTQQCAEGNKLNWIRVQRGSISEASVDESLGARKDLFVPPLSLQNASDDAEKCSDAESTDDETSTSKSSSPSPKNVSKNSVPLDRSASQSDDSTKVGKDEFPPLTIVEVSELVALLIKCSDAKAIEPLRNIIPREIIVSVRKMLEQECS